MTNILNASAPVILAMLTFLVSTPAGAAESETSGAPSRAVPPSAHTTNVGLFASVGGLATPASTGAAADVGVRVAVSRHVALGLDYGWGVLGATGKVQDPTHLVEDRWWLMPSIALVIPGDRMRLDLGLGAGLGTGSGYTSWSSFGAGPFKPEWAFQLAPAARAHAIAAFPMTRDLDLFARADVGTLVLAGNSIGIRNGNERPELMDTTWLGLSFGVQTRVY